MSPINDAELVNALRSSSPADVLNRPLGSAVVVDASTDRSPDDLPVLREAAATLPCVIFGVAEDDASPCADLFDVIVAPHDPMLDAALETVGAHPLAATALAVLLRGVGGRSVGDGLAAESAVYSTLQAGPEFAAWRAITPTRSRASTDHPTVCVERSDGQLRVTLSRPEVHNAFSARMRDELIAALEIAIADPSIAEVVLDGAGPSFCSGGDLDEFGSRPDPATAYLVRLARSAGRALAMISDRVTARIHGACLGSGIELPAFAHRVIADPNTEIALPEVGMGLIPGAGGTVSLPRRIGRHRTALLALSRTSIDAETALRWGLVDEIES